MVNETIKDIKLIPVGMGYAKNCENCIISRRDPISTHGDIQYVSYYIYKTQLVS